MLNSSIRTIDMTQSGATTPGQSELGGNNDNEGVLHILHAQSSGAVEYTDCFSEEG